MLWHKVWLETRSRFGIGLALLFILAAGSVFEYPVASRLITQAGGSAVSNGPLGRVVADAIAVQRDFRGFVWWQWHRQNLTQMWTLFAVLLGSGGLLSGGASRGGAVHDVAAGLAESSARRPRGDRPGRAAGTRHRPDADHRRPVAGDWRALQPHGRRCLRRVPVPRRCRLLQPRAAAVHGVRRSVAAAAPHVRGGVRARARRGRSCEACRHSASSR